MIYRITFFRILILLSVLSLVKISVFAQQRPNVIVILSDDGGYDDFGCYGGKEVYTPHIDELAKQGIRFECAYASASVCAPSRAGLLTGRYQQRFGFEHNISKRPITGTALEDIGMDTSVATVADFMRYNGYKTVAIGKWHQGDGPQFHPLKRGFDHFYGFIGGDRSYFPIPGKVKATHMLMDDDRVVPEDSIRYLTETLTDKAISYVHQYRQQPFFMYLAFNAVHTPVEPPLTQGNKYAHVTDPLRRAYLAMLENMDSNIGRLIQQLKNDGLYENTLIIFMNDNGAATNNGADNGQLRGLKGSKWEGGIRVPMIMQWPAQLPKGKVANAMVSGMDILPTSLDAIQGKNIPGQQVDGLSLLSSYKTVKKGHDYLFWRRGVAKAVRHAEWKLIVVKDDPILLFNLKNDLKEQHNLAEKYPDRVKDMLNKLAEWEKKMAAPKWLSGVLDNDQNQMMKHRMEVIGRSAEKQYP
ncbi:sulfatase-like hydrolase/transferase [Sphingobacterium sp.]|uniref:sulfatase-like hydrolase/transferase n=1 Tax=Sphingobacterium sp. TaxID=341027 RepID=UPI0031DC9BA1